MSVCGGKIKCVSYVRVSTDMQANKEFSSIEVQEKIIRDYVANHPEYVLVDSFADRGRSAKNMNRPAIKQLIERIKQSDIRVVLSYRLDRVSREKLSFYEFEALLKSYNVKLIYTNDINFEDNPSGNLAKGVVIATAQYERETTSMRIKDKYHESLKAGYHAGGYAPLGYKIGVTAKSLEISEHAHLAKEIYQMYLGGQKPAAIAKHMSAVHGMTPEWVSKSGKTHSGRYYTEGLVKRILENPTYAGYVFRNNNGNKELFEGRHEAIITRTDWEEVQRRLSEKPEKPADAPPEVRMRNPYLLKKILFCSCGANMTVGGSGKKHKDGTPYLYYTCTRKQHERSQCSCDTAIAKKIVEEIVFSAIGYMATQDVSLKEVKDSNREYKESLEKEQLKLRNEITILDKAVQSSIEKFVELSDDPNLKSSIEKHLKAKSQKLTTLRNRLSEVNLELSYFKNKVNLSDFQIKASIENLDFCKDMLTPVEKSEIIKETISKMVISVKKRKGYMRICQLTIYPPMENQSPIVIEFSVNNSLGRGIWEILSPFELSSGYKKPLPKSTKRKQHFMHDIVKMKRLLDDEGLSIRELAKRENLKHGMIGRQLKMLDRLSASAIELILKLRYERQTKQLTFRKLEEISKQPQANQVKLIKKLANLR